MYSSNPYDHPPNFYPPPPSSMPGQKRFSAPPMLVAPSHAPSSTRRPSTSKRPIAGPAAPRPVSHHPSNHHHPQYHPHVSEPHGRPTAKRRHKKNQKVAFAALATVIDGSYPARITRIPLNTDERRRVPSPAPPPIDISGSSPGAWKEDRRYIVRPPTPGPGAFGGHAATFPGQSIPFPTYDMQTLMPPPREPSDRRRRGSDVGPLAMRRDHDQEAARDREKRKEREGLLVKLKRRPALEKIDVRQRHNSTGHAPQFLSADPRTFHHYGIPTSPSRASQATISRPVQIPHSMHMPNRYMTDSRLRDAPLGCIIA